MPGKQFKGESSNGDFQEALQDALKNAQGNGADKLVVWELEKVSGENGGFVGKNLLTVVINVTGG